jgi:23S rRNA (cytidine1920-2'-O)/16S rRNA (cytidine1409-2'-O)-methyltransferase
MILAGQVVVGDHAVSKPGTAIDREAAIRIKGRPPYVSRGGTKLRGALDEFDELDPRGRIAMDVGASTGGFTDCLLQAGVARVYAVDVGYGQLAWKLSEDPRVTVLDRQNIRTLSREEVADEIDLVVADCSFISLSKVLPSLPAFLAARADAVVLVKPQFEVGRELVGKGGIVRSAEAREQALTRVVADAEALGFVRRGTCPSPITGKDGNVEYLLWLSWAAAVSP